MSWKHYDIPHEKSIEECENRFQELRARILGRLRSPCTGRFDKSANLEDEFLDDVRLGNSILKSLISRSSDQILNYYYVGLQDELEWAHESVTNAWKAQDRAMERSREAPRKPEHPPSQTLLDKY
tara:strand:+ start:91 stop:465 length:375 start_codon:yes stop_codon:yes gene_type:complete